MLLIYWLRQTTKRSSSIFTYDIDLSSGRKYRVCNRCGNTQILVQSGLDQWWEHEKDTEEDRCVCYHLAAPCNLTTQSDLDKKLEVFLHKWTPGRIPDEDVTEVKKLWKQRQPDNPAYQHYIDSLPDELYYIGDGLIVNDYSWKMFQAAKSQTKIALN